MKKITVTLLSIALIAMGAIFVFGQTNGGSSDKAFTGKRGFGKHGKRHRRGGGKGFGMGGRMFKNLDLTDAQKEQMKTIRQTSRESSKALRQQMKANRQQLQQLTENGQFDEGSVAAVAQQLGQLHAQMIVEQQKVKAQMYNVLTADQKSKLAQMKAEFQQKMQERKAKWAEKKAQKQAQQNQ